MTSPQSRHDLAESLFAAWLTRREAGASEPLEELLRGHPALRAELEELHANWKLFDPILSKLVGSFAHDPNALTLDTCDAPSASELTEKLGVLTPPWTRYRFRGEVGRGGCGVVLKVWDSKLKRVVAMKLALAARDARQVDSAALTRFVDEARIASQLSHPGIVPVYDLGADDEGRPYFTMKLVKGVELTRIFEQARERLAGWNPTRALTLLLRVCEAMAYAHDRGVIHRDLKPSNVMVGPYGEIYVMDWGLARVLSPREGGAKRPASDAITEVESFRRSERERDPASPLATRSDAGVGTLCYMPPEQARGDQAAVGPRSDVYALGAMLYHLLAGAPPFLESGERIDREMLLLSVLRGTPTPIAQLAPKLPRELHAICERAMARDPAERYGSMQELAEDLQAYLERRVVRAHRSSVWTRGWKWVRRNPGLAAGVAVGLTGVLGGGAVWAEDAPNRRQRETAEERVLAAVTQINTFEALASDPLVVQGRIGGHWPFWVEWVDWLVDGTAPPSERATVDIGCLALHRDTLSMSTNGVRPLRDLYGWVVGARRTDIDPVLATTVARLERLKDRRDKVRAKQYSGDLTQQWNRASDEIARSPHYGGLKLVQQAELAPIGPDPRSGLWLFAHFTSGTEPKRQANGQLATDQSGCIVFVLIPAAPLDEPFFLSIHLATRQQVQSLSGDIHASRVSDDPLAPALGLNWERAANDCCKAAANWFELPSAEELCQAVRAGAELLPRGDAEAPQRLWEWTRELSVDPHEAAGELSAPAPTRARVVRVGDDCSSHAATPRQIGASSSTLDLDRSFLPVGLSDERVGFRLKRPVLN